MSKKYTLLDKEDIDELCKAVRESHSVSEAIDDDNLATNSTFSSVKIDNLIKANKAENKEYTDKKIDESISGTIDDTLSNTSENAVQNKVIKSYVDNSLANIQSTLNSKANSADVYTKSETATKIMDKVAEIVAGAPADFDTLKEMSDWIANHEGSAAAMNAAINTNSTNIANLQSEIGDIETVLSSVVEVTE